MTKKINTKNETTKKSQTKKVATPKVEESKAKKQKSAPVESKAEETKKTAPVEPKNDGVYVDEKGVIRVSERLKEQAKAAVEAEASREHKKYNRNQSNRVFLYEVYYGNADHKRSHGEKQKEFTNLQTAINWIAREAKFFVEEGIERECYSIVLNDTIIAEY